MLMDGLRKLKGNNHLENSRAALCSYSSDYMSQQPSPTSRKLPKRNTYVHTNTCVNAHSSVVRHSPEAMRASTNCERRNRTWYIHVREDNSAVTRNEQARAMTQTNLTNNKLHEKGQMHMTSSIIPFKSNV